MKQGKPKKRKSFRPPSPKVPDDKKTRFSFEKIDLTHQEFSVSKCTSQFWEQLIRELKKAECMAFRDFLHEDNVNGRHEIDFSKTTKPGGFPGIDSEQLTPFQFAVGEKSLNWRIHGYVADAMFYIVWLDPEHRLYGKTVRTAG